MISFEAVVGFTLTNVPIIAVSLAIALGLMMYRHSKGWKYWVLRFIFLLPVGVQGIWAFIFHVFYADLASTAIGWEYSPFEYEVGVANLGVGIMGIYAFIWPNKGFWLATTIMVICFNGGAGIGHIQQILIDKNFAYNNAGPILYCDILLPLAMIVLLKYSYKTVK